MGARELADGLINVFQREGPHGFNRNAQRVLDAISDNAAALMHSACIQREEEMAEQWRTQALEAGRMFSDKTAVATKIAEALSQVTIQEQK